MIDLFKLQLQIRHDDWPIILQGFIMFFVLSIAGYLLLSNGIFEYFLLVISLMFLIFAAIHFNNIRKTELQHLQYKVQAINELTKLLPIRSPLPAMTGWAATPELALNVYKIIEERKPETIAELGSGVTTIVSAYALEKFNPDGRILSFDHDSDFAEKTRGELKHHQLEKFVNIFDSPLEEITLKNKKWKWYNINFSKFEQPIDLLIIDGPPFKTQKNARYPAVPSFYSKLSDNAVIIFHDTAREMEARIVKKWLKEFPDLKHTTLKTEKGITIFRREAEK